MNIDELQEDIKDHKDRFEYKYNEIAEIVIPFFVLHQKLFDGVCKIQDEKYRLSSSETDVLITTFVSGDKNHTISPTKLHQKLLFTTGAITKVLKKLEDKEYIIRVDNSYDKRSRLVQLSKKGVEIAIMVFEDMMSFKDRAFSTLTKKEKELFKNCIIKVLKEM